MNTPNAKAPQRPETLSPRAIAKESRADESRAAITPAAQEEQQAPLLPGLKPVLELLENRPERVDTVFLCKGRHGRAMARIADLCRREGVRFSFLESRRFSLVYAGNSQGVVARLFETGYVEWDALLSSAMDAPLPLLLALDQVQDPGNAGTLARTLYAMGGAGLVSPRHNGVYLGAAAAKASAGALERLPVSRVVNLGRAMDRAKNLGFTIYGASGAARTSAPDNPGEEAALGLDVLSASGDKLRLPAVLILGGEEDGLRPGMIKRCDALLRIPMLRDFDSLNVAQAGAIIISCFVRTLLEH